MTRKKGKLSDHWVPVCTPHTDRYSAPLRTWRVHTYRPLPDSSVRRLGQWIVGQEWETIKDNLSPTEQAVKLEKLLQNKLDEFCPQKSMKIGSQDKPFITQELKNIHRRKSREYTKNGKSRKYRSLKSEFELKYKNEAFKYIKKNVEDLKESNPGKAFRTLKKLGAQPEDCTDSNDFTLLSHSSENLTALQSAEIIAEISSSFLYF